MIALRSKSSKSKSASKKQETSAVPPAAPPSGATARDYDLILSPVVTEKTSLIGVEKGRAVFRVRRGATKHEIRGAIERIFKVQVAKVRTVNMMGKVKGNLRTIGKRADYKKAYVTLKEGYNIDVVEGV